MTWWTAKLGILHPFYLVSVASSFFFPFSLCLLSLSRVSQVFNSITLSFLFVFLSGILPGRLFRISQGPTHSLIHHILLLVLSFLSIPQVPVNPPLMLCTQHTYIPLSSTQLTVSYRISPCPIYVGRIVLSPLTLFLFFAAVREATRHLIPLIHPPLMPPVPSVPLPLGVSQPQSI